MTFYFKVFARWLGYIVERTLIFLGGVFYGVSLDILKLTIDLIVFPIRYIAYYDEAGQSLGKEKRNGK